MIRVVGSVPSTPTNPNKGGRRPKPGLSLSGGSTPLAQNQPTNNLASR